MQSQGFKSAAGWFAPGGPLSRAVPRFEQRAGQAEMAAAVETALRDGRVLLAEAGTGTGKTLAYLLPVLLSGLRTVVSTGTKTLQDQILRKDLPALVPLLHEPVSIAGLKGKANYLCLRRFKDLESKSSPGGGIGEAHLRGWARSTATGDRAELEDLPDPSPLWESVNVPGDACLGGKCPDFDDCFLTRARREAAGADLVIVNHHLYLADLAVRESGYGAVIPPHEAVVFDEAHGLEDAATDYFGFAATPRRFEDFVRDITHFLAAARLSSAPANRLLTGAADAVRSFFSFLASEGHPPRLTPAGVPVETRTRGDELAALTRKIASTVGRPEGAREEAESLARRGERLAKDLSALVRADDPAYVFWIDRKGRPALRASPIDVSSILGERIFSGDRAVVLTSATLAVAGRMDLLRARLGIGQADEMVVASPFDYPRQALLYVPVDLPDPREPEFAARAADEILAILARSRGRALVLFTSHQNLAEIGNRIAGRVPFPLLRQGEQPRETLLARFRKEIDSVLLATGSFWEGVDIPGEALSCVIVDRLPFDSPGDPVLASRIDRMREGGEDPFFSYQLPQAVIALRQGLGRLIRSSEDRGVLVVLDRRIATKSYGRIFRRALPPCPFTTRIEDVEAFFGESVDRLLTPPSPPGGGEDQR